MKFTYEFVDGKTIATGMTTKGNMFQGIARTNPTDTFNANVGIDLSTTRAKIKQVRQILKNKEEKIEELERMLNTTINHAEKLAEQLEELELHEQEIRMTTEKSADEKKFEEDFGKFVLQTMCILKTPFSPFMF